MEKKNITSKMAKTQIFNVVILDQSGSMSTIREAAVSGLNETIAGIRKAQETYADTQEHFFTLVAFCGCEKRKIYDKVPALEIGPLSIQDYRPCCTTPLYDAMGFTLNDMRHHVEQLDNAMVVVTIITDGLENASREYTGMAVKKLVEDLRGQGWTFTYMGANQDAVEVAFTLSIRNARNFDYSAEGAKSAMCKDSSTRMGLFSRIHDYRMSHIEEEAAMPQSERNELYATMADDAFDEVENM